MHTIIVFIVCCSISRDAMPKVSESSHGSHIRKMQLQKALD